MVRRNKIISILLIPLIIMSVLVHGPTAQAHEQEMESGLELSKKAEFEESTRVINYELEAYQKGEVKQIEESQPLDIILVLDQSSSMDRSLSHGYKRANYSTYFDMIIDNNKIYYLNMEGSFEEVIIKFNGSIFNRVYSVENLSGEIIEEGLRSYEKLNRFYYNYSEKPITRLDGLRTAVDLFIHEVVKQSREYNVNHRIAFVGYAAESSAGAGKFKGTELLGTTDSNIPKRYPNLTDVDYEKSLIDVRDESKLFSISQNISLYGGTATYLGLDMARKIIKNNESDGREKVVILMTDGEPYGNPITEEKQKNYIFPDLDKYPKPKNQDGNRQPGPNEAIRQAQLIKDLRVDLYTIGLNPKADNAKMGVGIRDINTFLHYVSSNFHVDNKPLYMMDTEEEYKRREVEYKTPPNPSKFYFSSNDTESLNDIFILIKDNIVTPPDIKLSEETILIDSLSDYFYAIDIDSILVEEIPYEGKGEWLENASRDITQEVKVEVDQELGVIKISNYNYSQNVITEAFNDLNPQGAKLRLKFKANLIDGFIGGGKVITNKDTSGIYFNDKIIEKFPVPTVDVPLKFTIDSENHSIYLSNDFELDDLIYKDESFKYKIGDSEFELDGINNSYVDVKLSIIHDDEVIWEQIIPAGDVFDYEQVEGKLDKFSDTTNFKINYEVISINDEDVKLSDQFDSKVYVFKPDVKSKNTESYLGEKMIFADNFALNDTVWLAEDAGDNVPEPQKKYVKPNLEIDIPKIEDFDLNQQYYWQEDKEFSYEVLLNGDNSFNKYIKPKDKVVKHKIVPVSLIVEKNVDKFRADDNFKFKIKWLGTDGSYPFNNIYDMDVFLKGNEQIEISGLPIGKYEVVEDTKWSWRYETVGNVSQNEDILDDKMEYKFSFENKLINKKHLGKEVIIKNRYE